LAVLLASAPAYGQTNAFGYTQSTITTSTLVTPPAGSIVAGAFGVLGDDEEAEVVLPWSFPYYGVSYTSLWVVDNGAIRFDLGDIDYTNTCLPTVSLFGGIFTGPDIAVYWDDLDVSLGGAVHAWEDTAGGRFIVSWENVPMYGSFVATDGGTFQIHLYPSGNIETHYQDLDFDGTGVTIDDAASATIGMNDQVGVGATATVADDALLFSCNTLQPTLEGGGVSWLLCTDADLDGYGDTSCGGADCDDTDPAINPGATETCDDGVDDDCDGVDLVGDADNDGYDSDACVGGNDCDDTDPLVNPGVDADGDGWDVCLDCNDNFAFMNPGATEVCGDGIDQDCNGMDDQLDGDGDGYEAIPCGGTDCDDTDPALNPGTDADGDGEDSCVDCDDADPAVNTSANEICNGIDDNCDTIIDSIDADADGDPAPGCGGNDCDDSDPTVDSVTDDDGDGFATCDDCDDTAAGTFPGAPEVCDQVDTDCDTLLDVDDMDIGAVTASVSGGSAPINAAPSTATSTATVAAGVGALTDLDVTLNITHTWVGELDISITSPGGTTVVLSSLNGGSGFNFTGTIFDDEAPTAISSGFAPFTGSFQPDGSLSDLDGEVPVGTWTMTVDNIGPDVGSLNSWGLEMLAGDDADGDGAVDSCGDCDPTDASIHPGAAEICGDGIDQDCDGSDSLIDDDGDGYYSSACGGPDCDDSDPTVNPTVDVDGDGADMCVDCDDNDPALAPGNTEVCGDGIDQDCSGEDDLPDADNDGYRGVACGGTDCDDSDPNLHPGIDLDGDGADACFDCDDFTPIRNPNNEELCSGIDNDCNGIVDDRDIDEDGFIAGGNCGGDDCDDDDPLLNPGIDADDDGADACEDCDDDEPLAVPGGVEVCSDGIDNDCVGGEVDGDQDLDGVASPECGGDDCDDLDPTAFPGAEEVCDGVDRNCDGEAERVDEDEDGYLDWSCGGEDCDDTDVWKHPGVVERCNGLDDDCDGSPEPEADCADGEDPTPGGPGDGPGDGCDGEASIAGADGGSGGALLLLLALAGRRRREGTS